MNDNLEPGEPGRPNNGQTLVQRQRAEQSFTSLPAQWWDAIHVNQELEPLDYYVLRHHYLRHLYCLSFPHLSCFESALAMASALVFTEREGKKPWNGLGTRVNGFMTLAMIRRWMRCHSMASFPIYSLEIPAVVQTDIGIAPNSEQKELYRYVLVNGTPRDDGWCILQIIDVNGQLALHLPRGFNQWDDHVTFAQLWLETEIVPRHDNDRPLLIMTSVPIVDFEREIFWRAHPTPTNALAIAQMKAQGRACTCCSNYVCPHELLFTGRHLGNIDRLVCLTAYSYIDGSHTPVYRPGSWNGTLESGSGMYTVERALEHTTVVTCQGVVHRSRVSNQPYVAHNVELWHGSFMGKVYKDCANIPIAGFVIRIMLSTLRLRRTLAEKWLYQHLEYEGPTETKPMYTGGLVWHAAKFTDRTTTWSLVRQEVGWLAVGAGISTYLLRRKNLPLRLIGGLIGVYYLLRALITMPLSILGVTIWKNRPAPFEVTFPPRPWAYTGDLTLKLPMEKELIARLATRKEISRDMIDDITRRLNNQTKWESEMGREEYLLFVERTETAQNKATLIPRPAVGMCYTCYRVVPTYRNECSVCKWRRNRGITKDVFLNEFTTYVGFLPIRSAKFLVPLFTLDSAAYVEITHSRRKMTTRREILAFTQTLNEDVSTRGRNCGPLIGGIVPRCFPRGFSVGIKAFAVRLGCKRAHVAQKQTWDDAFALLVLLGIIPLYPEKWEDFLAHQHSDKRLKNELARVDICEGWAKRPERAGKMKSFPKAEKGRMPEEVTFSYEKTFKSEEKPRCICNPDPMVLATLGRYTHPQTKWLAWRFSKKDHLFYAGCAKPADLNFWLNWTLSELHQPITLVDDISAMDANHSALSFDFHRKVRDIQFPWLNDQISNMYDAIQLLYLRIGPVICHAENVNASGVPDTSYKNSLICIIIRLLAIAYAVMEEGEDIIKISIDIIPQIYLAAAGDDGLTRLCRTLRGVDVLSPLFIDRYRFYWSLAGFGVKAFVMPETRWRMATFLGCRPVWAGEEYEWMPEPSRRLKTAFWQIDNNLHWQSWGRGIATQLIQMARPCPVLGDIAEWYLKITTGPILDIALLHSYNPFYGFKTHGAPNLRADTEFCLDYSITRDCLDNFRRTLLTIHSPLVDLRHFVISRILQEES